MKEYLLCEWAIVQGITLSKARRCTEKDNNCTDWCKALGFIELMNPIGLSEISILDIKSVITAEPDYLSSEYTIWIISNKQWDALIKLNSQIARNKNK